MACNCGNKNRAGAAGASAQPSTYRVSVGGRVAYESSSKEAAEAVASRFDDATIVPPGETA
jgi:hypothetical protein